MVDFLSTWTASSAQGESIEHLWPECKWETVSIALLFECPQFAKNRFNAENALDMKLTQDNANLIEKSKKVGIFLEYCKSIVKIEIDRNKSA